MKKFIVVLIGMLMAAGAAFAAVNVESNGVKLGPAQDINFTGGTVTGNGPVKTVSLSSVPGDFTATGNVSGANVIADGALYAGVVFADPCTAYGVGYVFFNNSGEPCYCKPDKSDVKMFDGSTGCF